MKTWTKIALAAAVVVVAAGSIAWGGHAGRHGMMKYMMGAKINEALDYVDATPQQRAVVEQVKKDLIGKFQAAHKAHQGLGPQIAGLLAADSLDVKQLHALADQKADAARAMAHEVIDEAAKIHAALTPAQRQKLLAKWKTMHEQRQKRHQDHHQEQGGFGGTEQ